jgi:hypothetical protein
MKPTMEAKVGLAKGIAGHRKNTTLGVTTLQVHNKDK